MSADERDAVLRAYVGERGNRRHKPGRAFERTGYRFDVLCDYGAFRDLQRHRLLTLEWQRAVARARVRHAGGDRRRRDDRRVAPRDGGLGLDLGDARGAGRPRRRPVRGRDGVPDPVRDADERPRGDAPDRAPLVAAGPPDLPARRAADARPDRHDRRPPRDRRDDDATSTRATSISSASRPSAAPRRSARPRGRAEPYPVPRISARSKLTGSSSCSNVHERGSRSGRHRTNCAVCRNRFPSMWS